MTQSSRHRALMGHEAKILSGFSQKKCAGPNLHQPSGRHGAEEQAKVPSSHREVGSGHGPCGMPESWLGGRWVGSEVARGQGRTTKRGGVARKGHRNGPKVNFLHRKLFPGAGSNLQRGGTGLPAASQGPPTTPEHKLARGPLRAVLKADSGRGGLPRPGLGLHPWPFTVYPTRQPIHNTEKTTLLEAEPLDATLSKEILGALFTEPALRRGVGDAAQRKCLKSRLIYTAKFSHTDSRTVHPPLLTLRNISNVTEHEEVKEYPSLPPGWNRD